MTWHDWLPLLSSLVPVVALIYTIRAWGRTTSKDRQNEGQITGQLTSDMGYIKASVDDIKRKQEVADAANVERHMAVVERVRAVEESTKQAHHRINRLEGPGNGST